MPWLARTKSSSPKRTRNRLSEWLTADWLRKRRSPARVVERSRMRTANTTRRFRSTPLKLFSFMVAHHEIDLDCGAGCLVRPVDRYGPMARRPSTEGFAPWYLRSPTLRHDEVPDCAAAAGQA
jgi:hypothetical protein